MLSKRSLRILIIIDLLLIMLAVVVGFMSESSLPEPLRAYEQARLEADLTPREWIFLGVGLLVIIGLLVASIGLMVFWRPARALYLATVTISVLLIPLAGPFISSGWTEAIGSASSIINGVVLAVIYFSPLRDLYEKPKTAS